MSFEPYPCLLMAIFDKLQKLNQLRKTSKAMQKELQDQVLEVTHKGVKVQVRGDFQLKILETNGKQDADILDAVNRALKEVQKQSAKKMRGRLGELGLDL